MLSYFFLFFFQAGLRCCLQVFSLFWEHVKLHYGEKSSSNYEESSSDGENHVLIVPSRQGGDGGRMRMRSRRMRTSTRSGRYSPLSRGLREFSESRRPLPPRRGLACCSSLATCRPFNPSLRFPSEGTPTSRPPPPPPSPHGARLFCA